MASFSVDITDVIFAAANTGYKDITITNMPQAGVNCTITAQYSGVFGYRIPGSDPNVYRVYTNDTNSSDYYRTGVFKITNAGDSTDYVEVNLTQLGLNYIWPEHINTYKGTVYDVICDSPDVFTVAPKKDFSNAYYKKYNHIYVNHTMGDNLTAHCTILLDGDWNVPGSSSIPEWCSLTSETTYTDTGFKRVLLSVTNNYGAPRIGTINFCTSVYNYRSIYIYQNGYPSSTSGCTESLTYTSVGGSDTAILNHTTITDASSPVSAVIGMNYVFGSDYTINRFKRSNTETDFTVTLASNLTNDERRTYVEYLDNSYNYLGHTTIIQDPGSGPAPTLTASPSSLTYPSTGGGRVLDVTYATSLSTNEGSMPSWLSASYVTVGNSERSYTITAASNVSTSGRDWNFELADANMSLVVPITQAAGSGEASMTISPSSDSVTNSSGTVQITVTTTNISTVNYTISDTSWIGYSGVSGNVYTFSYSANTGSTQRQGTITFTGGGISRTFTLTQAGGAVASLVVSPTADSVGAGSGTYQVTVTATNIDTVSYSISDNWLSYVSESSGVYTFSYTANTGAQRQSVVTFSGGGLSRTFTLTQDGIPFTVSPSVVNFYAPGATTYVSFSGQTGQISNDVEYVTFATNTAGQTVNWLGVSGSQIYCEGNIGFPGREAVVTYTDESNSIATATVRQAGDTTIRGVTPSSYTFPSTGGTQVFDVYSATSSASMFNDISWITVTNTSVSQDTDGYHNYITLSAAPNTSSERTNGVVFYERYQNSGWNNYYYPVQVSQEAGSSAPVITVSPTTRNVGNTAGSTTVTVTTENVGGSVSYSISQSWLSYVSESSGVYTFSYTANTSSNSRTAVVTFSATGAASKTLTVTQSGTIPPTPTPTGAFKVQPGKVSLPREHSQHFVYFTNPPSSMSSSITYIDGSGWLTIGIEGDRGRIEAAANAGTRRRANVRFYDSTNSSKYVIVSVIQGGDGYDSIWKDNLYSPADQTGDTYYYHYKLMDASTNNTIYEGIAATPFRGTGPYQFNIDIPRVVEDYLVTDINLTATGHNWGQLDGYVTVNMYNMTTGDLVDTFKYWNDWSRVVSRYDYTRCINDPINHRGCDHMIMPFCVYYDDAATFSIVETENNGMVNTYTMNTPDYPFSMCSTYYYNTQRLDYKQDGDTIFSYDMTACGDGAFIYKNRFGGWDSFLIEGNIIKTDNYTKQNYTANGRYNSTAEEGIRRRHYVDEKYTNSVNINRTVEAHTGWLSDDEAERLVFHLLSSPTVYFQDLKWGIDNYDVDHNNMRPVRLTNSSAEYKKFRNGKRLVSYTITFEYADTQKVKK